jgi:hypothetical protein
MAKEYKKVIVLGASLGFWFTVGLRRVFPILEMEVWDDDDFVGGTGASRLPRVTDKKQRKVDRLNGFLSMTMGDPLIYAHPFKFLVEQARNSNLEGVLVVDCTDMALGPRRELWEAIEASGGTLLRISYDGDKGGIVSVSPGLPWGAPEVNGYGVVPDLPLTLAAAGIGSAVVRDVLRGAEIPDKVIFLNAPEAGADGGL